MTRNQLFIALAGGAAVLAVVSASMTSDDNHDGNGFMVVSGGGKVTVSGDDIKIGSRSGKLMVHTKDGTVDCSKNGGTVVIEREDGSTTEISCD